MLVGDCTEPPQRMASSERTGAAPDLAPAAAAPSPDLLDPAADPTWQQYVSRCAASGVHDLAGLDMRSVAPYLTLNQYHRDQLSRTVPLAPFRLYRSALELLEKDQCPSCWLSCCMCAQMRGVRMTHKVFVLMHHKEFGRGSNTGKLAVRTTAAAATAASNPSSSVPPAVLSEVTATSGLIQMDIPAQAQALLDLCERERDNTVVLFPSKDSITIEQFAKQRGWRLPEARQEELADGGGAAAAAAAAPPAAPSSSSSSSPDLPPCPPLNIILLDGTWRQARSMKFLLPAHIPEIRIDPFKYKLDGSLRPSVSVDHKVAEEMARADGKKVDDESHAAAGEVPSVSPAATSADPSSGSPASVASTSGQGKKAKVSQRARVHREGKKAPVAASTTDAAAASAGSSGDGVALPASPAGSTFVSLFYPLRKQSQPDRISTVEALVILLMELHEPPSVTHALLDLLRVLVDSMRAQCGMLGVYGTYTEAQSKQMRIDTIMAREKKTKAMQEARSDEAASSASNSLSASLRPVGTSRKQRSQRANLNKPCLQWNRDANQPCVFSPCRYSHTCMLCNGEHKASTCSLQDATQQVVNSLRNAAIADTAGTADPAPAAPSTSTAAPSTAS